MPPAQRDYLSSRYFPNVSMAGFYSPHSLSISINAPPPTNGERGSPEREKWFDANLPLIVHEYQHALDHIGTLVGRRLLDGLSVSYRALEFKLKSESVELYRWVEFHDLQKRFYRRAYYTENDASYRPPLGRRPRWRWDSSVGQTFDVGGRLDKSDPIVFIRFHDDELGVQVARQPLTAAALFEARAMACELEQLVLLKGSEFGTDKTQWEAFNAQQQSLFYDADLTIYSAPVHFVSTQLNISDPVVAYRLTAILAYIALNIGAGMSLEPRPLPGWDKAGADTTELTRYLIERRDPGFMFFCLAACAQPFDGDEEKWLDECLTAAGFPSRNEVEAQVDKELLFPQAISKDYAFERIYWSLCLNGAVNARRLRPGFGLFDKQALTGLTTSRGPIALPNAIVGATILSPSAIESFMSVQDQEFVGRLEQLLADNMSEFLAACR